MKNNWTQFKLRVNINVPVEKAYKAWATQEGLESFFLRSAVFTGENGKTKKSSSFAEAGDTYDWYWWGYPDSVVEKGKVLAANEKDKFSFTFSLGCPVSISIYRESDETIVELIESNLPADEETALKHYVGDSRGWIFYLANLKSVLEGGIDLRNRKLELENVITS
jgi:uncharacterized protein YndB with AHSA1/START domain